MTKARRIPVDALSAEGRKAIAALATADLTKATIPETLALALALQVGRGAAKKPRQFVEHQAQALFIQRVRMDRRTRDVIVAAVPNAARRSMATATMLKREGMLAGYPDIIIDAASPNGWHGLRIEFKAPGKKPRENQRAVAAQLIAAGYCYVVAYTADDAFEMVLTYLGGRMPR